jgi:hypothetical protein
MAASMNDRAASVCSPLERELPAIGDGGARLQPDAAIDLDPQHPFRFALEVLGGRGLLARVVQQTLDRIHRNH